MSDDMLPCVSDDCKRVVSHQSTTEHLPPFDEGSASTSLASHQVAIEYMPCVGAERVPTFKSEWANACTP